MNENLFTEYVVCSKCNSIYEYKDCLQINQHGLEEGKSCSHIVKPNSKNSITKFCNTPLLKQIYTKHKKVLRPIKVFPYQPLRASMTRLINNDNFLTDCEKWRERNKNIPFGIFGDIYDGKIWKKFSSSELGNFLCSPCSYLLCLNIDWFQPFSRVTYSVGVIYLTILNLPRHIRYKPNNIILCGVIPGPSEPALTLNSYLTPLCDDLRQFWEGITLPVAVNKAANVNVFVRLALACISCDLPASRKVCGFLSYNARFGCHKCLKEFTINVSGKSDYSGYNHDNWPARSNEMHRDVCTKLLSCKTKSELKKMESSYGVRYSILLSLPYFDPVQYTVVDPMHNLFLGTGKHVMRVWVEMNIISQEALGTMESQLKSFRVPPEIGRIPSHLAFNGFTADQCRSWITIFSPIVLKGVIPDNYLCCWLLFVKACSILSSQVLSQEDINSADLFLLHFCKSFEQLCGGKYCTPNMHAHLHLRDCIEWFGPLHSFWCYSFERFNGMLGMYHTNMRAIESQLMRKFVQDQKIQSLQQQEDFSNVFKTVFRNAAPVLSFANLGDSETVLRHLHGAKCSLNELRDICVKLTYVKPLPPFSQEKVFNSGDFVMLKSVYEQLYHGSNYIITHISPFYQAVSRIQLGGDIISSIKHSGHESASSCVIARWPNKFNTITNDTIKEQHVGVVEHYVINTVTLKKPDEEVEIKYKYIFCKMKWKALHPRYNWFGSSAIVCYNSFESYSCCCFMPVQRIAARCVTTFLPVTFDFCTESVFIASPIPLHYIL